MDEIEKQIERIMKDSKTRKENKYGMGLLTSDNRPSWAVVRQLLEKDSKNYENLREIDRCLFLVCLEDYSPVVCFFLPIKTISKI